MFSYIPAMTDGALRKVNEMPPAYNGLAKVVPDVSEGLFTNWEALYSTVFLCLAELVIECLEIRRVTIDTLERFAQDIHVWNKGH